MDIRKTIIIWIAVLIVLGGVIVFVGMGDASNVSSAKSYTMHDPIYIDGNGDFATQVASEGWAGNGTEENPYIIENYDIDASTARGIYVNNTNLYFIIRNCVIHDGRGWTYSNSGIYFYWVEHGTICNITSHSNSEGILLHHSSNNIITDCHIYNNSAAGIYFLSCLSNNNHIAGCHVYNNSNHGISLCCSSNNSITGCHVYNNFFDGICLDSSSNNFLRNNTLENNTYNFCVSTPADVFGNVLGSYQDIDTSNTINGKPIYYIVGESNLVFDETRDIGYLGLVSCTNITVKNIELKDNYQGLLLVNTIYSTINTCQIYNNYDGIWLISSLNNSITDCYIYNNSYHGICLDFSSNNSHVTSCHIYNNMDGIYLHSSSNNNISSCYIYNNYNHGIRLLCSSNSNRIHHNNFNNSQNAYDQCSNFWDNGAEGNYWSDYTGVDENGDGIGDTPYSISGDSNQDHYPLVPVGANHQPTANEGSNQVSSTKKEEKGFIPGFEVFILLIALGGCAILLKHKKRFQ